MISGKLLVLIEKNADALISSLIKELRLNKRTSAYRNFSVNQLTKITGEVYAHLGSWLGDKTEDDIREAYNALGKQRKKEGVPLSQIVTALTITRNHLRRFIESEIPPNSTMETYQQMEFINYVTTFFDKALYHTVAGYEMEMGS